MVKVIKTVKAVILFFRAGSIMAITKVLQVLNRGSIPRWSKVSFSFCQDSSIGRAPHL